MLVMSDALELAIPAILNPALTLRAPMGFASRINVYLRLFRSARYIAAISASWSPKILLASAGSINSADDPSRSTCGITSIGWYAGTDKIL